MKTQKQISGKFAKRGMILVTMLGLLGATLPTARAAVEALYTFESPSTQTTVDNVLSASTAYDAEDYSPHQGAGFGPNLTAAAAAVGSGKGLDFTSFNTNPGNEVYTRLQTKSSTIGFQGGFTFAAWVNLQGLPISAGGSPPRGYTQLFQSGQYDQGSTSIYIDPNGKLFFSNAFAFNAYNSVTGTATVPGSGWTYLAVTWDGSTVKLYQNGALDASLAITDLYGANTTNTTPTVLYFGNFSYGTQVNGYMDNIYFADRALTQSEILAQVIPEPTTMALLGLGSLLVFRTVFREQRRNQTKQKGEVHMKTQKQMSGQFVKRGMMLATVLALVGVMLPAARAAVEVLYNFDHPSDTGLFLNDRLTADGTQNGDNVYGGTRVWTLVPGAAHGTTAGLWPNYDEYTGVYPLGDVHNYSAGMTWSVDINPTSQSSSGYEQLFWAGYNRGAGETGLAITPTGRLEWYSQGLGPFTSTSTAFFTPGEWHAMGVTYDPAGGGTLSMYKDGLLVQTFAGIGSVVSGANGTPDSETVFGFPFGVGGALTGQYRGYVDNIFMADRALSADEMFQLETHIPEPTTMALLGLGGLLVLRRQRKK